MNILCGLPNTASWERAAGFLGHQGFALDPARVFDSFAAARPDVVLVPAGEASEAVRRALARYPARLVEVGEVPPAADCPLDFPGGHVRPEFTCDVAVFGQYSPAMKEPLAGLDSAGLRLKVFGRGHWPVARFCGSVPPSEIADVYASAGMVADLAGDASQVLAVWAAGGWPLSVKKWAGTGIPGLDQCGVLSDPVCWAADRTGKSRVVLREDTLKHHTVAARLAELLKVNGC